MMKLKKIASSFVCLVILTAFTGAVSFEFSPTHSSKTRIELAKADPQPGVNFLIESEELDHLNDQHASVFLPALLFFSGLILFGIPPTVARLARNIEQIFEKPLLFLRFKSLRL